VTARAPILPDGLTATLGRLTAPAAAIAGPWWIVGSAAAALHGAAVEIADVDLLATREAAAELLRTLGLSAAPGGPSERFRSEVFGRWEAGPLAVEVTGGFHVRTVEGWREFVPKNRALVSAAGASWPVPTVPGLIEMGRLFGRPKDLARVAALEALL
jgi:hypothetical protein